MLALIVNEHKTDEIDKKNNRVGYLGEIFCWEIQNELFSFVNKC